MSNGPNPSPSTCTIFGVWLYRQSTLLVVVANTRIRMARLCRAVHVVDLCARFDGIAFGASVFSTWLNLVAW